MNEYKEIHKPASISVRQLAAGKGAVQLQDNRPKTVVRPAMQMKAHVHVNDDKGLEREADVMGGKALSISTIQNMAQALSPGNSQPVLQKKGERTAVENTRIATRSAKEQIRRGNRRASIISTAGRSAAKLEVSYEHGSMQKYNTGYRNKVDDLKKFVIGKMVSSRKYNKQEATKLIANNHTFLEAKAVEEISVGNCGEFSMVVFAHLVQNTTDQYIYRAKMYGKVPGTKENYDHAFAFTYNQAINVTRGVTTVDNIDKNKAILADAWDGYKIMTLKQFQDGENAYGEKLKNDNVRLLEMREAQGNQVFAPEIQDYIREWAIAFNKDFEEKMKDPGSTYYKEAKNERKNPEGFNTEGTNVVGINDIRTFDQQFQYSTDKEKISIISGARHRDLMNALNTYSDEDLRVLFSLMKIKQLSDVIIAPHPNINHLVSLLTIDKILRLFKYLDEVNKKILVNRLPIPIIFKMLVKSRSNRGTIVSLLHAEKFITLLSRANERSKKTLLDELNDRQLGVMILSKPANLPNLIHSITINRLARLLRLFSEKSRKRILRLMTDEQRAKLFGRPKSGNYWRQLYNS